MKDMNHRLGNIMDKKYVWIVIYRSDSNTFPVAVFDDINKVHQACRDFNAADFSDDIWLDVSQIEVNNREYLDELINDWLD